LEKHELGYILGDFLQTRLVTLSPAKTTLQRKTSFSLFTSTAARVLYSRR
jgi:hypothetical protein